MELIFHKVKKQHKLLIQEWLHAPHVAEFFYGDGLQNTLNNLELYCQGINDNGEYIFDYWLAFYNNEPFAFLITSELAGPQDNNDPYNKWYIENKTTMTLDILIGPTKFLGKGLAAPLIKSFIKNAIPEADHILIDPEQANSKAIHVYKKVGFKEVDEFAPDFNPKPHVMLRLGLS